MACRMPGPRRESRESMPYAILTICSSHSSALVHQQSNGHFRNSRNRTRSGGKSKRYHGDYYSSPTRSESPGFSSPPRYGCKESWITPPALNDVARDGYPDMMEAPQTCSCLLLVYLTSSAWPWTARWPESAVTSLPCWHACPWLISAADPSWIRLCASRKSDRLSNLSLGRASTRPGVAARHGVWRMPL